MADLAFGFSSTPIFGLLFPNGPAAIFRAVRPAIVSTFKSVEGGASSAARRATPHVGEEVGEVEPAGANGNASTAVVFPCSVSGIAAASEHVVPNTPFGGLVSFAMRAVQRAFFTKASAGTAASRSKVCAVDKSFFAAITGNLPQLLFGEVGERGQFPKPPSRYVDEVWHG